MPKAHRKGSAIALMAIMLVAHVPADWVKVLLKSSEVVVSRLELMYRAQPEDEAKLSAKVVERSTKEPG